MERGGKTQELVFSVTSPGNFEVGPLQASLQESVSFPGESSITFKSLLWKTVSVVVLK